MLILRGNNVSFISCCFLLFDIPGSLFCKHVIQAGFTITAGHQWHLSLRTVFASCHRPFAHTTNPQRSFSRLRSAIRFFPSMNDLYFLSDAQLEAISSALATTNDFQQVSRIKSLK